MFNNVPHPQNYEPGYDFDELWAFTIPQRTWRLLPTPTPNPGKRYLHASAVVRDQLVLYGGLGDTQGDVWAYDIGAASWELLSEELPKSSDAPGRRVGHTLTPVDQPFRDSPSGRMHGVLLLGGRYVEGRDTGLDDTTFLFDLDARAWRPVPAVRAGSTSLPAGRKYHGEANTWLPVAADGTILAAPPSSGEASYVYVTIMFGGTLTTPGLTCTSETWLLTLDCGVTEAHWQRLPDLHPAIYDVRGGMSASGAVFAYGGHLCSDSKAELPFYYTNAVSKLDLAQLRVKVPQKACRVPAHLLPLQRGQGRASMGKQQEL